LNDNPDGTYNLISAYGNIDKILFFDNQEHLLSDLTFAISVAQAIGLTEPEIIKGVSTITKSDLRQRFIVLKDFTIFDDSYNASLESILADLKYISSLAKPFSAFFGDVLELGESTENIHEKIGRAVADFNINNLYLYGSYSEYTAYGAIKAGMDPSHIFINNDISSPDVSIKHIADNHVNDEIILFKASHRLRLDKIADQLVEEERMTNER
jgi:UDP-N-acetylmuramoyl-tripeptide--D-alanyl-D-alanine ligase